MSQESSRKISKEEVAKLHRICKRKNIRTLDLRIEFVDHLCELMEEEWKKNPKDSFDQAFLVVYRSFGVYGFMKVAEEHSKTMSRRYFREILLFTRDWFTLPKVFVSCSILLACYFLCERLSANKMIASVMGLVMLFSVVFSFYMKNTYKKKFLGDDTILTTSISNYLWTIYFVYLCGFNVSLGFYERVLESSFLTTVCLGISLILCFGTLAILKKYEQEVYELKIRLA